MGTFVYTKRCQILQNDKHLTLPYLSLYLAPLQFLWSRMAEDLGLSILVLSKYNSSYLPLLVSDDGTIFFFNDIYITSVNKKKKTAPFTTLIAWQFIQTADNPSNVYPTGLLFWPSANLLGSTGIYIYIPRGANMALLLHKPDRSMVIVLQKYTPLFPKPMDTEW